MKKEELEAISPFLKITNSIIDDLNREYNQGHKTSTRYLAELNLARMQYQDQVSRILNSMNMVTAKVTVIGTEKE